MKVEGMRGVEQASLVSDHGQRSLWAVESPQGHKESDSTEVA